METTDNKISVGELVTQNFSYSVGALLGLFNTDDVQELAPYVKVLTALRAFSEEAVDALGIPIVKGMFKVMDASPRTSVGRDKMAPFVDNIAFALQDAASVMLQQQQHENARRAQAQQALASGRGGLLRQ